MLQRYKLIFIRPNKNKVFFVFTLKYFVYLLYIRCKARTQTNTRPSLFFLFLFLAVLFFFSFLSFPSLVLSLLLIRADHLANTSGTEQQHHRRRPPRHRSGIHSSHRHESRPPQDPPTSNSTRPPHPRPLQGERWARPRPVWYASRPEPCALGAQPDASPILECARA